MTAVKALSTLGTPSEPFRFIYVSGEGADQSERGMQIFSRIKGRTEKALRASETDGFKTLSVRPGMISPTAEVRSALDEECRGRLMGVACAKNGSDDALRLQSDGRCG